MISSRNDLKPPGCQFDPLKKSESDLSSLAASSCWMATSKPVHDEKKIMVDLEFLASFPVADVAGKSLTEIADA